MLRSATIKPLFALTLAFSLLIQPVSAQAQPLPEADQIRLLGKGVLGKNSRESLTIACVGENYGCDQLRFIHFKGPSQFEWIGPQFQMEDSKALKKMLKKLSKRAEGAGPRGKRAFYSYLAVTGLLIALIPILNSATPLYIACLSPFVLTGMGDSLGSYDVIGNYRTMTNTESGSYMTKQDGWNWSQDAKSIREKLFQRMVKYIRNPNGFPVLLQELNSK